MDIKILFGKNLQRYRKIAGLSQENLAELTNTSFQHISNIENGRNFVSAELLESIVDVLKISPAALFLDLSERKKTEDDIGMMKKAVSKSLKKAGDEILDAFLRDYSN